MRHDPMGELCVRTYGLYSWDNRSFFGYFVADMNSVPVDWDRLTAGRAPGQYGAFKKILMNYIGDVTKGTRYNAFV